MHLAYTVAFDAPGTGGHRLLAKMLAMSLVRCQFDGDILIFRNSEAPLFHLPRPGVIEHFVPTKDLTGVKLQGEAWCWKYRVAPAVAEHSRAIGADKILFLDADVLCLRNPDHLLDGDWDITYCAERRPIAGPAWGAYLTAGERSGLTRGGINSGTMAIASRCYGEVMAEWERIHTGPCPPGGQFLEQGAWNRLILDTKLRTRPFERDAIMFPMNEEMDYRVYREATLLHCLGDNLKAKVQFTFGLYMGTFFFDEGGTLLNLLDM
jgi:hypothetical protein